ncbi:MAG: hypothetical protein EPN37_04480 [Chitinophagaceae bacterium]|nr:MAG: hypothetical protein EPN37_04480 [Chitinophagaceae bacterium]
MKKFLKFILPFAGILLFTAPALTVAHAIFEQHPVLFIGSAAVSAIVLSVIKTPQIKGIFTAGIQKEIWENDIVANLFKNNQFLNFAFNADQYVVQGKIVHIPNAGATPNVVKNRGTLPATVAQRTDVDITYPLDEYTSDPILIPHADTVELSYDKRQSVTGEAQSKLRQEVAENMLVDWAAPTANVVVTTGGAVLATAPAATGNRALITLQDLQSAMTKMNLADVQMENRYALFDAHMYDQFIAQLTATQYRDFSKSYDPATGILGALFGFKIMMRSSVLIYDATNTVKPYGAAGATTDNEAVLCWQQNSVERALGEVVFYERVDDPTYYGDIYSFLLRMGGRIRRNDTQGVVAIVQAPHA